MNERIRELLLEARAATKEGKLSAPTAVWTEKFAYWGIKVPLLLLISVLNVFLLRKLKKEKV